MAGDQLKGFKLVSRDMTDIGQPRGLTNSVRGLCIPCYRKTI